MTAVPDDLGARGRAFVEAVVDLYEFTPAERELLLEAGRQLDLVDELREALAGSSLLVEGSTGRQRTNPLLAELRNARAELRLTLAALKLPGEEDRDWRTPAQRSAAARWDPARQRARARARRDDAASSA